LNPIEITTNGFVNKTPNDICSILLDTNRWSEFEGYSILPGIEKAEFEKRTAEVVGSRIKTRNTDGSSHVEEIIEWDVNKKVVFKFQEFNSPLKNFATHFIEEWNFLAKDEGTEIERSMKMYPKHVMAWLILKPISILMKKALEKNLMQLSSDNNIIENKKRKIK